MPPPIDVKYEASTDTVVIGGVRYAGDLFRTLSFAPLGTWLRVTKRKDGTVTVFKPHPSLERDFDLITGQASHTGI